MAFPSCGGTVVTGDGTGGTGGAGAGSSVDGGSASCGNGRLDAGEVCDGANLGGKTCDSATSGSRPFGTLSCTATCTLNTSGCMGSAGVGGSGGVGAGTGVGGGAGMGGSFAGGAGWAGGGGFPADFEACLSGDACVLLPYNCCGYCGPELLGNFAAVNARFVSDFQRYYCSGPIACPGCITYLEPNYTAACRSGRCVSLDVRNDELSNCTRNTDCRLRWGAECCERCAGDAFGQSLTAVRVSGFEEAVCGSSFGCPDCGIAEYPSNARAICSSGHCAVELR